MNRGRAELSHIERLAEQICTSPTGVTIVTAFAGMGKSLLLKTVARHLRAHYCGGAEPPAVVTERVLVWDIPAGSGVVACEPDFLRGFDRVVIARRHDVEIPYVTRMALYGEALSLGDDFLRLPPDAAERRYQSGWPLLAGLDLDDEATRGRFISYLGFEFLRDLKPEQLVACRSLCDGAAGDPSLTAIPPMPFWEVEEGRTTCPSPILRDLVLKAIDAEIERRLQFDDAAPLMAEALHRAGQSARAIRALQSVHLEEPAVRLFTESGGIFLIHSEGPEAYGEILAGFGPEIAASHETLVLSNAMRALKQGQTGTARRLIAERFGRQSTDPMAVFASGAPYSVTFKGFRLVMMIYEDIVITEAMFERLYDYLNELPLDAALLRGSFYNAILEFYIRQRRFNEADMAALQALSSYRAAGIPLLVFYVCMHRAVIRLLSGDALTAREYLAEAERYFAAVTFDSPADERIWRLVSACIAYEDGHPHVLIAFINDAFDKFAQSETWPSLVEFALHYGSQALSEHFSTISALGFLDRWRLHQSHSRHLRFMIEIRAALVMQNGNRWNDAAATLSAMQSRINRTWVEAAVDELSRLSMRDEIEVAFAWLRQVVHERPERPYLDRQINAMIANERITGRQRRALQIWLAYVLKRTGRLTEARAVLQRMFDGAGRTGTIAPLQEERRFLQELMGDGRIESFLYAAGPARRIMRRLSETRVRGRTIEQESGLSRREARILLLLCEGASNKFVALRLGISESTVKFHLTNLYRKLGCGGRREAIAVARARNWLN